MTRLDWVGVGVHVLVVTLLLISLMTTGVGASLDTGRVTDSTVAPATSSQFVSPQVQTPANNSTVGRHQNPVNETEQGDLSQVSLLLSESLATRLGDSSISLSREQYELARRFVGPEYRDGLGQYFEVAAQTQTESDDRLAEQFNETAANQRRLVDQLEEFNETQQAYRQARQEGNDTKARQLARDLRLLADDIEQTRTTLIDDYRVISDQTTRDLSDVTTLLNETVEQRLAEAEAIQNTEFTATELQLSTPTEDASFLEPVRLQGRLTSNGTPISERTIRLEVGSSVLNIPTDENGNFTVDYRPVTQLLGRQTIRVEYIPGNETNYQTSNATVTVNITQIEPTVDISVSPTEAQFNDTVRITGNVTAGGIATQSAPYTLYLDGEPVRTGQTTREGVINESLRVGTRPPDGDHPLRVAVGTANQSLGVGEDTEVLTILPSTPFLSVDATLLNASGSGREQRTVVVRGELLDEDDTPIEGQPIEITVEGVTVATAQTDRFGVYEATIEIPQALLPTDIGGEERLEIRATYSGEETLFEETTETDTVLVQSELFAVIGRNLSVSEGLTALLIVGSTLVLRRRYDQSTEHVERVPEPATPADTGEADDAEETTPIALARRLLDGGRTDSAVLFAYAAARGIVAESVDLRNNGTHWEFYAACRDAYALTDVTVDSLERLTALYEHAAFDSHQIDDEAAIEAVSIAERLSNDYSEPPDEEAMTLVAEPLQSDGSGLNPDSN